MYIPSTVIIQCPYVIKLLYLNAFNSLLLAVINQRVCDASQFPIPQVPGYCRVDSKFGAKTEFPEKGAMRELRGAQRPILSLWLLLISRMYLSIPRYTITSILPYRFAHSYLCSNNNFPWVLAYTRNGSTSSFTFSNQHLRRVSYSSLIRRTHSSSRRYSLLLCHPPFG